MTPRPDTNQENASSHQAPIPFQQLCQQLEVIIQQINNHILIHLSELPVLTKRLEQSMKDLFSQDRGNHTDITRALRILLGVDRLDSGRRNNQLYFGKQVLFLLGELRNTKNTREIQAAETFTSIILELSDEDMVKIIGHNTISIVNAWNHLLEKGQVFKPAIRRFARLTHTLSVAKRFQELKPSSDLSSIFNIFGKLADDGDVDCQAALKALASFLREKKPNGEMWLESFQHPQDISLILNALGKLAKKDLGVAQAILEYAILFNDDPQLRNRFSDLFHLSLTVNALGKLAQKYPEIDNAIKKWADLILDNPRMLSHSQDFGDFGRILNTFGKLAKNSTRCVEAIEKIAQFLTRNALIKDFQEQRAISLSLNGFAALAQDPERDPAVDRAVKHFAELLLDKSAVLHHFRGGQAFSLTLNAFGKWAETSKTCQDAIEEIAKALVKKPHGKMVLEDFVDPQHVSLTTNALSTLEEEFHRFPHSRLALIECARHLRNSAELWENIQNVLKSGEHTEDVSLVINAFGKVIDDEGSQRTMELLGQLLLEKQNNKPLLEKFVDPLHISHVLSGLVTLFGDTRYPNTHQAALEMVTYLRKTPLLISQFEEARSIACALNALVKLARKETSTLALIETFAQHLIERKNNKVVLESIKGPLNIALIANAFNELTGDTETYPNANKGIVGLARLLNDHPSLLHTFKRSRDIALTINAFGKLVIHEACQTAIRAFARYITDESHGGTLVKNFKTPQHLSLALNAFGKLILRGQLLPENHHPRLAIKELAKLLTHRPETLQQFDILHLSLAVNALGKLPEDNDCRQALERLALPLIADRQDETSLEQAKDPENITRILNGLTAFIGEVESNQYPNIRQAIKKYARLLKNSTEILLQLDQPENISTILNALGKWKEDIDCQVSIEELAKRLVQKKDGKTLFETFISPLHLSNSANGLANLAGDKRYPHVTMAIKLLAQILNNKSEMLTQFQAKDISLTLNALAKLATKDQDVDASIKQFVHYLKGRPKIIIEGLKWEESLSLTINAFSRLASDPDCQQILERYAQLLLERENSRTRLENMKNPQNIALSVGGLASLSERAEEYPNAAKVIQAFASELIRHPETLNKFEDSINLTQVLNALAKFTGTALDVDAAIKAFAALLNRKPEIINKFFHPSLNTNNIALTLNALRKFPEDPVCQSVIESFAQRLTAQSDGNIIVANFLLLKDIALNLNAFSALTEEAEKYPYAQKALKAFVTHIIKNRTEIIDLDKINALDLSLSLNALRKLKDDLDCMNVIEIIAETLTKERNDKAFLEDFREHPKAIALALNGLSALAGQEEKYPKAYLAMKEFARLIKQPEVIAVFKKQQNIALTLNTLGKQSNDVDCRAAMGALADKLTRISALEFTETFTEPRNIALSLNGLSRLEAFVQDYPNVERVVQRFARLLKENPTILNTFQNSTDISLTINAFARFAHDLECQFAVEAIANLLTQQKDNKILLETFRAPPDIARSLYGLSKVWEDSTDIEAAVFAIIKHIQTLGYQAFDTRSLTSIAYSLSHMLPMLRDTAVSTIQAIADHLIAHPEKFQNASVIEIQYLFKSLGRTRQHETIFTLFPMLETRDTVTFKSNDTETLANLAFSLLPVLTDKTRDNLFAEEKRVVVFLYNVLQPLIEEKGHYYFSPTSDSVVTQRVGPWQTRYPAVSFRQIQRTYAQVKVLVEPAEQTRLQQWLDSMDRSARQTLQIGLSPATWRHIAEIDDEHARMDLDAYLAAHPEEVAKLGQPVAVHPDHVFDRLANQALSTPGNDDRGAQALPEVTIWGTQQAERSRVYSIFHRLTENKVTLYYVKLPAKLGKVTLNMPITIEGKPYRIDGLGGNAMKAIRPSLPDIFNEEDGQTNGKYGKLIAIAVKETLKDSPLLNTLIKKLFPYKEAFFYFKRALIPSTPNMTGTNASDFVLEGKFNIAIFPDHEPTDFLILKNRQALSLRTYDGGGFIKASAAQKMPGYQKTLPQNSEVSNGGEGNLPAQALQHYPRNPTVAQEAKQKLQDRIANDEREGRTVTKSERFRYLSVGKITGAMGLAVPSSDAFVHIPGQMAVRPGQSILLGRSPYDKPNLRPIAHLDVATSSATAAFLSQASALQYSFVGRQETVNGATDKQNYFFAKGVLTVIPDAYWPAAYQEQEIVISAEDVKTHSAWTVAKQRVAAKTLATSAGFLVVTDYYPPGQLVAVPPTVQKRLDGDYDGDLVLTISDRPLLYEHIKQWETAQGEPLALKPPKTHTPALDESGHYRYSRTDEILATKSGVLEVYSGLQMQFLAQSQAVQQEYARMAVLGIVEGIPETMQQSLRQATLSREQPALRAQIQAQKDKTQHEDLQHIYQLLLDVIDEKNPPLPTFIKTRFPVLAHDYTQAQRVETKYKAIVNNIPQQRWSAHPLPPYVAGDYVTFIKHFMTLGIKMGTDAYKSYTAVGVYAQEASRLQGLFHRIALADVVLNIPYGKGRARAQQGRRWQAAAVTRDLRVNQSLAGEIMETAIEAHRDRALLPEEHSELAENPRKRPATETGASPSKRQKVSPATPSVVSKRSAGMVDWEDEPPLRRIRTLNKTVVILHPEHSTPEREEILKSAAHNYQSKPTDREKPDIYRLRVNTRGEVVGMWRHNTGGERPLYPQDLDLGHVDKVILIFHGWELTPEHAARASRYFFDCIDSVDQVNLEVCNWDEQTVRHYVAALTASDTSTASRTTTLSIDDRFKRVVFSTPAAGYKEYIGGGQQMGQRLYEKGGKLYRGVPEGRLKLQWDLEQQAFSATLHTTQGRPREIAYSPNHAGPLGAEEKLGKVSLIAALDAIEALQEENKVRATLGKEGLNAYRSAQAIQMIAAWDASRASTKADFETIETEIKKIHAKGREWVLMPDTVQTGRPQISLLNTKTQATEAYTLPERFQRTIDQFSANFGKMKLALRAARQRDTPGSGLFFAVIFFTKIVNEKNQLKDMPLGLQVSFYCDIAGEVVGILQEIHTLGLYTASQRFTIAQMLTLYQREISSWRIPADIKGRMLWAMNQSAGKLTLPLSQALLNKLQKIGSFLSKCNFAFLAVGIGFNIYRLSNAEDEESRIMEGANLAMTLTSLGIGIVGGPLAGIAAAALAPLIGWVLEFVLTTIKVKKIYQAQANQGREILHRLKEMYQKGFEIKDGQLLFEGVRLREMDLPNGKITFNEPLISAMRQVRTPDGTLSANNSPYTYVPSDPQSLLAVFDLPASRTIAKKDLEKISLVLLPDNTRQQKLLISEDAIYPDLPVIGKETTLYDATRAEYQDLENQLKKKGVISSPLRQVSEITPQPSDDQAINITPVGPASMWVIPPQAGKNNASFTFEIPLGGTQILIDHFHPGVNLTLKEPTDQPPGLICINLPGSDLLASDAIKIEEANPIKTLVIHQGEGAVCRIDISAIHHSVIRLQGKTKIEETKGSVWNVYPNKNILLSEVSFKGSESVVSQLTAYLARVPAAQREAKIKVALSTRAIPTPPPAPIHQKTDKTTETGYGGIIEVTIETTTTPEKQTIKTTRKYPITGYPPAMQPANITDEKIIDTPPDHPIHAEVRKQNTLYAKQLITYYQHHICTTHFADGQLIHHPNLLPGAKIIENQWTSDTFYFDAARSCLQRIADFTHQESRCTLPIIDINCQILGLAIKGEQVFFQQRIPLPQTEKSLTVGYQWNHTDGLQYQSIEGLWRLPGQAPGHIGKFPEAIERMLTLLGMGRSSEPTWKMLGIQDATGSQVIEYFSPDPLGGQTIVVEAGYQLMHTLVDSEEKQGVFYSATQKRVLFVPLPKTRPYYIDTRKKVAGLQKREQVEGIEKVGENTVCLIEHQGSMLHQFNPFTRQSVQLSVPSASSTRESAPPPTVLPTLEEMLRTYPLRFQPAGSRLEQVYREGNNTYLTQRLFHGRSGISISLCYRLVEGEWRLASFAPLTQAMSQSLQEHLNEARRLSAIDTTRKPKVFFAGALLDTLMIREGTLDVDDGVEVHALDAEGKRQRIYIPSTTLQAIPVPEQAVLVRSASTPLLWDPLAETLSVLAPSGQSFILALGGKKVRPCETTDKIVWITTDLTEIISEVLQNGEAKNRIQLGLEETHQETNDDEEEEQAPLTVAS